jgi:hypothetical protein
LQRADIDPAMGTVRVVRSIGKGRRVKLTSLAERIARVPEPSVRRNKAVTRYGLPVMGIGAGMLMNAPLSALAHASFNSERGALLDLMKQDGLRDFLEARDGFRPEPFGRSRRRTPDGRVRD